MLRGVVRTQCSGGHGTQSLVVRILVAGLSQRRLSNQVKCTHKFTILLGRLNEHTVVKALISL